MKSSFGFLPEARRDRIVSKEADGELLIYDLERDRAHCLNAAAAAVWKLSDGRTTVSEITGQLQQTMGAELDESVVELALKQLSEVHLLCKVEKSERMLVPPDVLSRRALVRRLGIAAVLLPLITSINAPTALANVSCTGACVPDTPNNDGCAVGCTCSAITNMCVNV